MVPFMYRIVVVVLVAFTLKAADAATDKGLPAAGSTVTLEPTREGYQASFDVATDEAYDDVKLTPADSRLIGRFEAVVLKTQQAPPVVKRMVVRVKTGALRQGPYSVTLLATRAASNGNVERDFFLAVPSATLDPPSTLVIKRVCDGIVLSGDCYGQDLHVMTNRPQLWEATQRHWLTGITLVQKGDTDAGGRPAGILQAVTPLNDVGPGASPRIAYGTNVKLVGPFPLGTSKGKLIIGADQLAAPVAMDFEVQSRTTRLVLVVMLVLGLVLGWITRHFLAGRLDRAQEQQKTYALLQLIDSATKRTADAGFAKALGDVRVQALEALAAKTVDETKTKASAAEKAFLEQQDAIRLRRAAVDQAYAEALAVLRARWKVPSALAESLAATTTSVEAILPRRPKNDFTQEAANLDSAVMQALDVAQEEATRCAMAATAADRIVTVLTPLLDATAASALNALARPPALPARVLPAELPKAHLDGLRKALEYVHAACEWIDNTGYSLGSMLLARAAAWEAHLSAADLPHREAWTDWLEEARHIAAELDGMSHQAKAKAKALIDPATALVRRLGDVMCAQLAHSDVPAIDALIAQGAYGDAIARVSRLCQPTVAVAAARTGPFESRNGGQEVPSAVAPAPSPAGALIFGRSTQTLPHVGYGLPAMPNDDATSIAVLAAASQRQLEVTGVLLNLTYGAIIVAGGYFLLSDKWVGTLMDAATAFFWAYATDIGADAATAAMRGLKK